LPSNNAGKDTVLTASYGAIDALLASQGLNPGDSANLQWAVLAQADAQTLLSAENRLITLKRFKDPVNSTLGLQMRGFNAYPNPSNGLVNMQFSEQLSGTLNIIVIDASGRIALSRSAKAESRVQLALEGLEDGVYWIQVQAENASYLQRLVLKH
jgi:hypothetical protein